MLDPTFILLWEASLQSGRARQMTPIDLLLGRHPRHLRLRGEDPPDNSFLLAQQVMSDAAVKQGLLGNESDRQDVRDFFEELTGVKDRGYHADDETGAQFTAGNVQVAVTGDQLAAGLFMANPAATTTDFIIDDPRPLATFQRVTATTGPVLPMDNDTGIIVVPRTDVVEAWVDEQHTPPDPLPDQEHVEPIENPPPPQPPPPETPPQP